MKSSSRAIYAANLRTQGEVFSQSCRARTGPRPVLILDWPRLAEEVPHVSQLAVRQSRPHPPTDDSRDSPPTSPSAVVTRYSLQYTRCRQSASLCALRSHKPRRATMRPARRSTPRPSRTCVSTATPGFSSRASQESRERECSVCGVQLSRRADSSQFPRTAGHRIRYAPQQPSGYVYGNRRH